MPNAHFTPLSHQLSGALVSLGTLWRVAFALLAVSWLVLASPWHASGMLWIHQTFSVTPLWWAAITLLGVGWMPFALVGLLDRPGRLAPWLVWVAFVLGGLASQLFKSLLSMPRPVMVFPEGTLQIIGSGGGSTGSMPSGHSLAAFVMATLWVVLLRSRNQPKWTEYLAWTVASMVAFSRVVVGAHWPADVVMGAGLGILIGLVSARVAQMLLVKWPVIFTPRVTLWLISATEGLGAWMAFTSNEGLPMVALFQQLIGWLALLSLIWRWVASQKGVVHE